MRSQPDENVIAAGVLSWWASLCVTAAVNIAAWSLAAAGLRRQRADMSPEEHATRRLQLILSGVYVLGCAFRSVLPLYDIPRLCLIDTALSTVVVGRSVATVAELCFVAQWALMLRETARATGSSVVRTVSFLILPLIAVAEICSWYAVLTTRNLGHVGENSLWGLSAALAVASMLVILPRLGGPQRRVLLGWCFAGITYVAFMFPPPPSRYLLTLHRVAPLGGLEERGGLDVALFQRRGVDQHFAHSRTDTRRASRSGQKLIEVHELAPASCFVTDA